MENDEDDHDMIDYHISEPPRPILPQVQTDIRPVSIPYQSFPIQASSRSVIPNGFRNLHASSVPLSDEEPALTNEQPANQSNREASILALDASHLSIDQPIRPTHDQIGAFLSDLELEDHDEPAPYLSELSTGFCYDVRMRYHCELEIAKDRRDYHPEDPRRIFEIYRELCVAGLIEDKLLLSSGPLVSRPLTRIDVREVLAEEVELVHDVKHWIEMKKTPCMPNALP